MEFKFYNYIFSNDLETFENYLFDNAITYYIKDNQMFFKLENEYCKRSVEASATFENDKITRLQLKCYPISFNNRKKIEEELDSNYKLIEKDLSFMKRIYETDDYTIVMHNPENILIDVQFEPVLYVEKKESKLQLKRKIIFTIIGVILSVLFMILYFSNKTNVILNTLTAIIAFSYAMYQFIFLYIRKLLWDMGHKIALGVSVPILYFLIVPLLFGFFLLLCGLSLEDAQLINLFDFFMVLVYLSPSFHLLILFAIGLSYA